MFVLYNRINFMPARLLGELNPSTSQSWVPALRLLSGVRNFSAWPSALNGQLFERPAARRILGCFVVVGKLLRISAAGV